MVGVGAVGHDAAADKRTVGEGAQTISSHVACMKEWGTDKHEGVGILFFVWGPLLGCHVRTGVMDGRPNWIVIVFSLHHMRINM